MARKEKVIRDQANGILRLLKANSIRCLNGQARVQGPHRASVRLSNGDTRDVTWDRLILATGSRPREIPSAPFDGERIISSNEALSLDAVPESMIIVGGGVIGCEFAFIYDALGSRITVVEALSRPLPVPSVDGDCSKTLLREMKKRRITFMTNRTVQAVEIGADGCRVSIGPASLTGSLKEKESAPMWLDAEKVLISVGRTPNTEGIGLEELGVKLDSGGWIMVNDHMETSIPGVFAIGDVLGPSRAMLAHVASKEGHIAAENALGGNGKMDYRAVPSVVFTMPEVAGVGLTEAQAAEAGYQVQSHSVLFRNIGKSQVLGELGGHAKIIWDRGSCKILGVHMIGPHVTELIAEGTLAVTQGCSVKELADTLHAHPTLSEIMAEVSFKALGRSLHG
jgi:dihydrolipoamide dehydrogenase